MNGRFPSLFGELQNKINKQIITNPFDFISSSRHDQILLWWLLWKDIGCRSVWIENTISTMLVSHLPTINLEYLVLTMVSQIEFLGKFCGFEQHLPVKVFTQFHIIYQGLTVQTVQLFQSSSCIHLHYLQNI